MIYYKSGYENVKRFLQPVSNNRTDPAAVFLETGELHQIRRMIGILSGTKEFLND